MSKVIINKTTHLTNETIFSLIISLSLFFETCFNGHFLVLLNIVLIIISIKNFIKINKILFHSLIWIIIVFIYTTILGLYSDPTQFSPIYNAVIYLNIIFTMLILGGKDYNIHILIRKIIIITFILCTSYIFLKEINMIIFRWSDYISGTCGYRLGISSNINPNIIAWLYGFIAILSFCYIKKNKIFTLIYGISIIYILFTGSKNGLLCGFVPIIFWLVKAIKQFRVKYILLIIVGLILFWYTIQTIPLFYTLIGVRINMFLDTFGLGNYNVSLDTGSTLKRLAMNKEALRMFSERPILGWGIGAFAKYSGFEYYSHNNYLEVLVSGGIVFFFIYYFYLIIFLLKLSFKYHNNSNNMIAIFLFVSNFLMDIGSVSFYSRYLYLLKYVLGIALLIREPRFELINSIKHDRKCV